MINLFSWVFLMFFKPRSPSKAASEVALEAVPPTVGAASSRFGAWAGSMDEKKHDRTINTRDFNRDNRHNSSNDDKWDLLWLPESVAFDFLIGKSDVLGTHGEYCIWELRDSYPDPIDFFSDRVGVIGLCVVEYHIIIMNFMNNDITRVIYNDIYIIPYYKWISYIIPWISSITKHNWYQLIVIYEYSNGINPSRHFAISLRGDIWEHLSFEFEGNISETRDRSQDAWGKPVPHWPT